MNNKLSLDIWLNNKGTHTDNLVELKLTNIKKRIQGSTSFEDIQVEFDDSGLMNDLGSLFKTIPFFYLDSAEIEQAFRIMDGFILDHYKGNQLVLDWYEKGDKVPEDIKDTFLSSPLRKPWWDILMKVNQNKMSSCRILEKPIPSVSDLDIAIWSGAKVLTPFVTELNENFRTIILRGKLQVIDSFIEVYKMSNRKISV